MAPIAGIAGFAGTVKFAWRHNRLFSPAYLKLLGLSVLACIVAPVGYYFMLPGRMSLTDAFLLRVWDVGVRGVIGSYFLFGGVLLGSLFYCLDRQIRKSTRSGEKDGVG